MSEWTRYAGGPSEEQTVTIYTSTRRTWRTLWLRREGVLGHGHVTSITPDAQGGVTITIGGVHPGIAPPEGG